MGRIVRGRGLGGRRFDFGGGRTFFFVLAGRFGRKWEGCGGAVRLWKSVAGGGSLVFDVWEGGSVVVGQELEGWLGGFCLKVRVWGCFGKAYWVCCN